MCLIVFLICFALFGLRFLCVMIVFLLSGSLKLFCYVHFFLFIFVFLKIQTVSNNFFSVYMFRFFLLDKIYFACTLLPNVDGFIAQFVCKYVSECMIDQKLNQK